MPTRKSPPADALRSDAAALHAAVSDLVRIYQYRDRDRICCHDISVTQYHALEALLARGPMRSQDLAGALRLDKSTTTRVVDALARKGYVERYPDAEDGRALSLRVTRGGRALHEKIDRQIVDQHIELLRDLEPGTRAAVTDVIRRLARVAEARFVSGAGVAARAPADCATGAAA